MIRQDYFIRMVQELTHALARVQFLRRREEYEQALQEIDRVFKQFWDINPQQPLSLEQLISACVQEEESVAEKLVSLADLLREQGDVFALQQKASDSQNSYALALGLYLETLRTSVVSMDIIEKAEQLVEQTKESRLPAEVLKRLLSYYEARGMLAKAEDVLFDWLDTSDPNAPAGGLAFYERQAAKSDQELARGDLPRDELEAGRVDLLRQRAGQGKQAQGDDTTMA
jgi:hypothetical protein